MSVFVNTDIGFLCLSLVVGETGAGKASRSLAQHIPGQGGMEGMKGAASGVVGDLARARIALDERGQKLGELEDRTAAMMASADSFSKHAHDVRTRHFFWILKEILFQVNFFFFLLSFLLSSPCRWCWSTKTRSGTSSDGSVCPPLDSVITPGSLLFFNISLHGGGVGGGVLLNTDLCFHSQHNITHPALPQPPEEEETPADHTSWEMEEEKLWGIDDVHVTSFSQSRREVIFHIHQSCTRIYIFRSHECVYIYIYIYIYKHTLLFCSEGGWKTICYTCTLVAWLQSFSLCPLWCLSNTWGEKSDDPLTFMTNQVTEDVRFYRNDWINVGLQSVWFSLFYFYFLDLSFCRSVKKCPFPQVELSKLDRETMNLSPLTE